MPAATSRTTAPASRPARPLRGLLLAGCVVLGAATLMGVGLVPWPFTLLGNFRPQYAALGLALGLLAAITRHPSTAAAALGLALANGVQVAPAWTGDPDAGTTPPHLRLLLLNVGDNNHQAEAVVSLIRDADADVLALVEVDERWLAALEPVLAPYVGRYERPRADAYGMALYSRLALESVATRPLARGSAPTTFARIRPGAATPLWLVVTHAPPPLTSEGAALRDRHLAALADEIEARHAAGEELVLLGDLNATPWSPAWRDLVERGGLRDTRAGFGLQGTWPARQPGLRIPIDHVLTSPAWATAERRTGPWVGSDHLPVHVEIARRR